MNNRERAQQIADEHGNDAYSVALAMLEEQNKIKADAASEVAEERYCSDLSCDKQAESEYYVEYFRAYANKLENQND